MFSGFKGSPWTLLVHQGRKTGRAYTTPIVTIAAGGHYYAPLPYGEDVDWLRNVLHQGGGILKKDGEWFAVEQPELVPTADVLPRLPERTRQFMARFTHIAHYLQLERTDSKS